jgi:hypothetical protein
LAGIGVHHRAESAPFLISRSNRTGIKSAEQARTLWGAIADRFVAFKLVLHPPKKKVVGCKVEAAGRLPRLHFDFLSFKFESERSSGEAGQAHFLAQLSARC